MKRIFFLLLAILCCSFYAIAQVGTRMPADLLTWNQYGFYFRMPLESVVTVDEDYQQTFQGEGLEVDVQVLDRRQFSDQRLGELVVETLHGYGIPVAELHGGPVNPTESAGLKGVMLYGVGQVEGQDICAGMLCLLNPDTFLAFMMRVKALEEEMLLQVLKSAGINTPNEHKVR